MNAASSIQCRIKEFSAIKLAYLFGSAAEGAMRHDSDVDIAIACNEPMEAKLKRDIIDKLSIATQRPIDLIDMRTCPIPLLSSIFSQGHQILNRNPDIYAMLLRRLWRWNEDMAANHDSLLASRREAAFSP